MGVLTANPSKMEEIDRLFFILTWHCSNVNLLEEKMPCKNIDLTYMFLYLMIVLNK